MHCIKCGEEITGVDIIVHNSNNIDEHMCEKCTQKLLYENDITIFKWEYYNINHPEIWGKVYTCIYVLKWVPYSIKSGHIVS